jgi:hypothetical protein
MRTFGIFEVAFVGLAFGAVSSACTAGGGNDRSYRLPPAETPAPGPSTEGGGAGGASPLPGPVVADSLTAVVPTDGCGKAPAQLAGVAFHYTIQTSGTKDADCADTRCGPWSYVREYYVTLPTDYDATKPYPIIFEGPGCAGTGKNLYSLPGLDGTVIRVGLSPSGEANSYCFDINEGDDSIEWPFYEVLYDRLASQFCFDRNRVFAAGNVSSNSGGGGWLANELGCRYAGDPIRPVRAVLVNNGGLPTDPGLRPTCTTKPMAGIWIHGINEGSFALNAGAIARAMGANGCTMGTGITTAPFSNFPIGGTLRDDACLRIDGCPEVAPLVLCPLPVNDRGLHAYVAVPAFTRFVKLFESPPLLAQ